MSTAHRSVLYKEALEALGVKPSKTYIDATLNGGGHTKGILELGGVVLGIDVDPQAIKSAARLFGLHPEKRSGLLTAQKEGFIAAQGNFANITQIASNFGVWETSGVLFDLGLSSLQLEEGKRGFSFKRNEILDMRFNPEVQPESAVDIVNKYSEEDLEGLISSLGEEQFAGNIAKNIIRTRREKPIIMTDELVSVISQSVPEWYKHRKINFATKTFQALRVAVNDELGNVKKGMEVAIDVLKPGGRLVVISFQGLEDKIAKEVFREKAKKGIIEFVVKGTIRHTWEEQKSNPRARSAKMKVIQKCNL